MLSLFRNNRFSGLIFLLVYTFLVRLPGLLGLVQIPKNTGRGGLFSEGVFWDFFAEKPFWSVLAGGVVIFLQALIINNLDTRHRIIADRTWLPSAMYVLLTAAWPETLFISPTLLALTFVPLTLDAIFKCYKQIQATALIFNVGFFISMTALFFPAASLLLLGAYFGILSLKTFKFRENVVLLVGWFVPLFLAWTWQFLVNNTDYFWAKQFQNVLHLPVFPEILSLGFWIKIGLAGVLVLCVLLGFVSYFSKKLIQVQKFIGIFYWFLVIAVVIFIFSGEIDFRNFLLAVPVLAMFLALSFGGGKNRVLPESLHLFLLATIVASLVIK